MLAVVILAAQPKPSAALIMTVYDNSIKRTESIPSGSIIFDDEEEVLASITTGSFVVYICNIRLTSLAQSNDEKPYQTGWSCPS